MPITDKTYTLPEVVVKAPKRYATKGLNPRYPLSTTFFRTLKPHTQSYSFQDINRINNTSLSQLLPKASVLQQIRQSLPMASFTSPDEFSSTLTRYENPNTLSNFDLLRYYNPYLNGEMVPISAIVKPNIEEQTKKDSKNLVNYK